MEGLYKIVIQLAAASGLAEDTCENVFHCLGTDPGTSFAEDATEMDARFDAFYNTTGSGAATDLANYIGEQISRTSNACKRLYYHQDIADLGMPWGSPVAMRSWTLDAAAAGVPFPSEVACCVSFHGTLTDVPETQANPTPPPAVIRPAARRRGRIYLGPLMAAAGTEDGTTHEVTPSSAFRNSIIGASVDLHANFGASNEVWAVYSRAAGEVHSVEGGYVDYAFDTQRRRGQDTVTRQVWP